MPKKVQLSAVKHDILTFFEKQDRRVYDELELSRIFDEQRKLWRLSSIITLEKFVDYLVRRTPMVRHKFSFPRFSPRRYVWENAPVNEILLSLKANSYFSHHSAVFLHGLTENAPSAYYVTFEQAPKLDRSMPIKQQEIDEAFQKPVRASQNFATFQRQRVYLLNGMYTGQLGVIEQRGERDSLLRLTSLERTLLDIVVRPNYAGGVAEVLQAFRLAKGRLSTNKLLATYKQLNFVYPYHQAIGFYLERAGYGAAAVRLFSDLGQNYEFYLVHGMGKTTYIKSWRLHVPTNL